MYRLRVSGEKNENLSVTQGGCPSCRGTCKMLHLEERRLASNSLFERKRVELAIPTSGDKKSSDPAFYV